MHAQRQIAESRRSYRSLRLLGVSFFVLMAAPLSNFRVGPAPIYIIDLLLLLTWASVLGAKKDKSRLPLAGLVYLILVAMFTSEIVSGIRLGTLLQPVYIVFRTSLAISLFFLVPRIVCDYESFNYMIKRGLLGAVITALLMILSSFPQSQTFVAENVFAHTFLVPSSSNLLLYYSSINEAARGRSLIGVSILSGAFLNTFWPLIFLLRVGRRPSPLSRVLIVVAMISVPIAVAMSYSRGAIFGMAMILAVVVVLNSRKVRQPMVIGVVVSALFFTYIGWESQYLKFEWLQAKTQDQLENPYGSVGTSERLFAYTEPFLHLVENPQFLFFGQGFAREKVDNNPGLLAGQDAATHAVFAAAYYGYGMLAAAIYMFLLFSAMRLAWRGSWEAGNLRSTVYSKALLASLLGLSSWFMLGHAAVSEPRGAMLLFVSFGLVVAHQRVSDRSKLAAASNPFPGEQVERIRSLAALESPVLK